MESSKYAPGYKPSKLSPAEQKKANRAANSLASKQIDFGCIYDNPLPSAMPESTPAHPAPPIVEAAPANATMETMLATSSQIDNDSSQFAQTGMDDNDLFADDFEPLAEPTVEELSEPILHASEVPPPLQRPEMPHEQTNAQSRKRPSSSHASGAVYSATATNRQSPRLAPGTGYFDTAGNRHSPDYNRPARTAPAVRGDRSLTGGAARAKLTEEELVAKVEAMKLKNTALEEAHARATADEARYRAEEEAQIVADRERARKERQERQQMMGERERNAARKLKAMNSRDWDMNKREQEERQAARRGAHGGVAGGPSSRGLESWLEDQASQATQNGTLDDSLATARGGYGRGGRGRGRGGATRGRGLNSKASMPALRSSTQQPPKPQDFPALPAMPKIETKAKEPAPSAEKAQVKSPGHAKGLSWADQMDD